MSNHEQIIDQTVKDIIEGFNIAPHNGGMLEATIRQCLTDMLDQLQIADYHRHLDSQIQRFTTPPVASMGLQAGSPGHGKTIVVEDPPKPKIRLNLGNISPVNQDVPMPLPQPKIPAPQVALQPKWQQFDKGREYLIELKQWFYEKEREQHPDTSPPTKILQGYVLGESEKAILFGGHCATVPAVICYACHHPLMDSVSQKLGIGPICRGRLRDAYSKEFRDIADEEKRARAEIESIEWRGWLPKSQLESYKEVTS
jgi:hypothetical protein